MGIQKLTVEIIALTKVSVLEQAVFAHEGKENDVDFVVCEKVAQGLPAEVLVILVLDVKLHVSAMTSKVNDPLQLVGLGVGLWAVHAGVFGLADERAWARVGKNVLLLLFPRPFLESHEVTCPQLRVHTHSPHVGTLAGLVIAHANPSAQVSVREQQPATNRHATSRTFGDDNDSGGHRAGDHGGGTGGQLEHEWVGGVEGLCCVKCVPESGGGEERVKNRCTIFWLRFSSNNLGCLVLYQVHCIVGASGRAYLGGFTPGAQQPSVPGGADKHGNRGECGDFPRVLRLE